MPAQEYNYDSFNEEDNKRRFIEFAQVLHVGDPAPDGEMLLASTGQPVRLSDYWKTTPVVIEFGSYT